MIYLSGCIRSELLGRANLGFMMTPHIGNRIDLSASPWAADTGCFTQPEAYSDEWYLAWLDRQEPFFDTCLFATAPDRVQDAEATLEVARPALEKIRHRVPVALVAQDGLEHLPVPWDEFDCLFVGGSTVWKLSEAAYGLVAEANQRGKWTHMGRCNSMRRYVAAAQHGYDSADGTYLAFGPDVNIPKMEKWLKQVEVQKPLWI